MVALMWFTMNIFNVDSQDGWTPLIAASKEGHVDVVAVLLEHAAKYNIPDTVRQWNYNNILYLFHFSTFRLIILHIL